MKNLLLFLCLVTLNAFSQSVIQMKDGSKITVKDQSIHVSPNSKKIHYKLSDVEKEQKVKFSAVDFAKFDEHYFKIFTINKKTKGYYILAEANGKTLATIKSGKVISRGGFESVLDFYDLLVLDKENNIVEQLTFTGNNSEKSIESRSKVLSIIQTHFQDCPKLLEKAKLFESNASDTNNRMIMTFLDVPTYVSCY